MQIQIKQPELEQILRSHLGAMGINCITGMSFTATRGADGVVTEIEVGLPGAALAPIAPAAVQSVAPADQAIDTPITAPVAPVAAAPAPVTAPVQAPEPTPAAPPKGATPLFAPVDEAPEASPKVTGKNLFA